MSISPRRTYAPPTMPLTLASSDAASAAAPEHGALIDAYVAYLAQTGRQADARYRHAAERFSSAGRRRARGRRSRLRRVGRSAGAPARC